MLISRFTRGLIRRVTVTKGAQRSLHIEVPTVIMILVSVGLLQWHYVESHLTACMAKLGNYQHLISSMSMAAFE